MNLSSLSEGKSVYPDVKMPLTSIEEIIDLKPECKYHKNLQQIVDKKNGLWSNEAEKYLLENSEYFSKY